jgi:SOS-response transcriptional repressor LexA
MSTKKQQKKEHATFAARLHYLLAEKHWDQVDLVRESGIDKSTISLWLSGKRKPRANSIRRLCRIFNCDFGWLRDGVQKRQEGGPITRPAEYVPPPGSGRISTPGLIPVLGNVPAGIANDTVSEEIQEYISVPDAPPHCYALKVTGDSMEPTFRHGDYVLFVIDEDVPPGSIVIVNDAYGESMVKRLKKKGGTYYLVSDNPAYKAVEPDREYRIVGKVAGAWRRLGI